MFLKLLICCKKRLPALDKTTSATDSFFPIPITSISLDPNAGQCFNRSGSLSGTTNAFVSSNSLYILSASTVLVTVIGNSLLENIVHLHNANRFHNNLISSIYRLLFDNIRERIPNETVTFQIIQSANSAQKYRLICF